MTAENDWSNRWRIAASDDAAWSPVSICTKPSEVSMVINQPACCWPMIPGANSTISWDPARTSSLRSSESSSSVNEDSFVTLLPLRIMTPIRDIPSIAGDDTVATRIHVLTWCDPPAPTSARFT